MLKRQSLDQYLAKKRKLLDFYFTTWSTKQLNEFLEESIF
jgi:hypothetical protein